ncbi:MAG: homoserine dehydrogenase [Dehalococcoidia bacterium]|nr:homoserine dehydrogenase [Dehalococcoidia bacterium]MDP6782419.1 homoserine dehydrogenase [Dehalococcoidia bacterium]
MRNIKDRKEIVIGLLGLGVVGSGVAQAILERKDGLAGRVGCPLRLQRVLVRHPDKPRAVSLDTGLLTTSADEVLNNPEVDIVVELMGGEDPALPYARRALTSGKHLVTANKEVMAKHGPELVSLAQSKGVELRYEASVGGGIPLIGPFMGDLAANRISAVHGIINGTTNYILSRMAAEGLDFNIALKAAQELGYAEADPTNDVDGKDAAYKLAILATLAFNTRVRPEDVYREGIRRLTERDFRYAGELGYAIKLLAIAKEREGAVEVRVHPALVPQESLLAKVSGAYNAVQVEGDLVGQVIFYGLGAGSRPTTSAVVADVLAIARRLYQGIGPVPRPTQDTGRAIAPISRLSARYYLRMVVADRPGVLAQISRVLGDLSISIASVIQMEADEVSGTAELVLMTRPALEESLQQALREMQDLGAVTEIASFIRVEA